ncbi:LysM peptidoglycan-binding domain-containing protein [bacterium]|nr:LysM peptidoglycan-binding domain-containing protein [bacterium]
MKIKGTVVFSFLMAAVLLLSLNSAVFAQEKIKMDEYKAELADYTARQADSEAKIAKLEGEIEALKKEIDGVQANINAEWEAIYDVMGVTYAEVDAYRSELNAIDAEIDGLAALSPEELFEKADQVDALKKRIAEAKANKIGILSEMEEKIAALEGKLANLEAKIPGNKYDQYTVVRGDYLWKIAKKPDIYADPYQWIRIYCVNKDQIKDPDVINPDQVFNIARGVGRNEHLVEKGEWLSKISGYSKVFSDPTKWTKLYEANKDIVRNANLIYPYQVLTIPRD